MGDLLGRDFRLSRRTTPHALLCALALAGCQGAASAPPASGLPPETSAVRPAVAPSSAVAASVALPPRTAAPRGVVFSAHSEFNDTVYVIDDADTRALRFGAPDYPDQGVVSRRAPGDVLMTVLRAAAVGLAYPPRVARVLMLGLGAGIFSRMVHERFADVHVDVVEIDPVVVDVAKRWFGVEEDDRLRIHVGDGRAFVESATDKWDLVFLDAYGPSAIPEALSTKSFFDAVRRVVAPGGAVMANFVAYGDATVAALPWTFAASMGEVHCFAAGLNRIIVARPDAGLPDPDALRRAAAALDARARLPWEVARIAEGVTSGPCDRLR